ncbi:hypothetical protein [Vreelandella alkaliphila]|uniref:hypothetical protein n=1 Tax=Vreelandella alkaliphila TaxID=272774 RepID=UPI0023310E96|nr:hypothetical protein [Halomonas alkaliphila]
MASPVFENTLSAFVTIAILFGALSFALYNYLDGITKDIPKELSKNKPYKYKNALISLRDLKREVIYNIALIIFLLLVERMLFGIGEVIYDASSNLPIWVGWVIISARVSCLVVGIYAAIVQFRGFLTANDLRTILMENGD